MTPFSVPYTVSRCPMKKKETTGDPSIVDFLELKVQDQLRALSSPWVPSTDIQQTGMIAIPNKPQKRTGLKIHYL